jgi:phospholipid-translocating ATPase
MHFNIYSDALNNAPLKWVYMNMLSTGPAWLFIVLGVVIALLPDILIGVWEAYSAGEGVLVNQVKPIIFFFSHLLFVYVIEE